MDLGLFLNLKTLDYLLIGAYHNIQQEPEPCFKKSLESKPEPFFRKPWSRSRFFFNSLDPRPASLNSLETEP